MNVSSTIISHWRPRFASKPEAKSNSKMALGEKQVCAEKPSAQARWSIQCQSQDLQQTLMGSNEQDIPEGYKPSNIGNFGRTQLSQRQANSFISTRNAPESETAEVESKSIGPKGEVSETEQAESNKIKLTFQALECSNCGAPTAKGGCCGYCGTEHILTAAPIQVA